MLRLLPCMILVLLPGLATVGAATKPNIVVILSDDQGYADVSYNPHSPREVRTPHIDALARSSVICTQGYTSGHVCSTTRAGFMTGRYQQRFGIYTAGEGGSGVPFTEKFFPQYLASTGYHTGAFGKWHLGFRIQYNAIHRGFDEFYGFMGRGAHDYFDLTLGNHPIYRGLQPIEDKGYLTHRITSEAISFIQRHKQRPFFLYVAYNAVHAPAQAPAQDIQDLTGNKQRDTLMAMLKHLDEGVGQIVTTLKQEKIFNNTLLFYLTDNGGSKAMLANNAPLRGFKQQDYEGGIRVPFIVSWPTRLPGGTQCHVPVMSIDILPTALAAVGLPSPTKQPLDGKDMLAALQGKADRLHDNLYWSSGGAKGTWAIRSGPWKLVGTKGRKELFNLATDIGESKDLSRQEPGRVKELARRHDAWLNQMADPVSGVSKKWDPEQPDPPRKKNRAKNGSDQSTINP